eukprot:CAMPEP_0197886948 /NCGR_PEP_ID=MMETSP1439-20131203/18463_1 /TAXON_ID=66791 /ORGANISM="Gonyaulax spinifera, Strain CCMP409" /LENGTH=109 /DNA_ID=CAMNT_0043506769 /DNA_START=333 /DNA_END=662 /DNA_ORIENTATION=+
MAIELWSADDRTQILPPSNEVETVALVLPRHHVMCLQQTSVQPTLYVDIVVRPMEAAPEHEEYDAKVFDKRTKPRTGCCIGFGEGVSPHEDRRCMHGGVKMGPERFGIQ